MMNARSSGSTWPDRKSSGQKIAVTLLVVYALAIAAIGAATDGSGSFSQESGQTTGTRQSSEDKIQIRVACIGDSITYGDGLENRETDAYPSRLQELLGEDYQVFNHGFPGKTLQWEGSGPYDCPFDDTPSEELPRIVVIMLGTNDAMPKNWDAERYERQLGEMVDAYLSLESSPRVLLAIPPAAFCQEGKDTALYDIPPERISGELAEIIRRVAAEKGVELIDVNTPTSGHPELTLDGIHPNEEGSRVIAEIVAEANGFNKNARIE